MDWKTIVIEAKRNTGFTQHELARELGCSQSAICDLMHGRTREPRFNLGQQLLTLAGHPATAPAPTTDIQAAAAGQGA